MDQLHEETIFASRNSASRNSASRNSASRNSASRNPASRNSASRNPASRNPASRNSISRNLHIKKSKLCAQSSADKTAHEEDVFESNPGEGSLHPVRVPREERREEGLPAGPGHQGGGAAPGRQPARVPREERREVSEGCSHQRGREECRGESEEEYSNINQHEHRRRSAVRSGDLFCISFRFCPLPVRTSQEREGEVCQSTKSYRHKSPRIRPIVSTFHVYYHNLLTQ